MTESTDIFISKSSELKYKYDNLNNILEIFQGDMKKAGIEEYLDFISRVGDALKLHDTGKLLFDTRALKNYNIDYRAAAVNNMQRLLLNKAPFFVLAVIKGPSFFENSGLQVAIGLAKKISSRFLDGKMFDDRESALKWLTNYSVVKGG